MRPTQKLCVCMYITYTNEWHCIITITRVKFQLADTLVVDRHQYWKNTPYYTISE